MPCKICGRPHEGNAGDYYHEKECERNSLSREMAELRKTPDVPGFAEKMKSLESRHESACYVGD